MENELEFPPNPFMHHRVTNEIMLEGPFTHIEGLFIPIMMGSPGSLGTGSFSKIYEKAISEDSLDVNTLKLPIYPYKMNSLHYFAITGNGKAIETCFENNVKFI